MNMFHSLNFTIYRFIYSFYLFQAEMSLHTVYKCIDINCNLNLKSNSLCMKITTMVYVKNVTVTIYHSQKMDMRGC